MRGTSAARVHRHAMVTQRRLCDDASTSSCIVHFRTHIRIFNPLGCDIRTPSVLFVSCGIGLPLFQVPDARDSGSLSFTVLAQSVCISVYKLGQCVEYHAFCLGSGKLPTPTTDHACNRCTHAHKAPIVHHTCVHDQHVLSTQDATQGEPSA